MGQEKVCDFDGKLREKLKVSHSQSQTQDWSTKFQIWRQLFHFFFGSFLTFKVPSAGRTRYAATAAAPVGKPRFEVLQHPSSRRFEATEAQTSKAGSGS